MGPMEIIILVALLAVVVVAVLRRLERRKFEMNEAELGAGEATVETGKAASRTSANATFRALVFRYKPAYRAARNLSTASKLMVLVGAALLVWGTMWMDSGYARQEMAAPLFLVGGFASVVGGFIFAAVASILRAVLDRTAFTAPGLDDADRVRLAYEAGGEAPPR